MTPHEDTHPEVIDMMRGYYEMFVSGSGKNGFITVTTMRERLVVVGRFRPDQGRTLLVL